MKKIIFIIIAAAFVMYQVGGLMENMENTAVERHQVLNTL